MLNIRLLLSAATLAFIFSACQKENTTLAEGTKLKMTTSQLNDSISYESFNYDNQNRVTLIEDSNNNGAKYKMLIEYNAQGQPLKLTASQNQSYFFSYDNNGRIVKKLNQPASNSGNSIRNVYSYDSKGRLIADSVYSSWTNEVFSYTTYTYNENDNVVERKEYNNFMGSMQMENSVQLLYDDKPNPHNNLGTTLYFITNDDRYLSRNNKIQVKYQDGTIMGYEYEYQNNGLPKKVLEKHNEADPSITYMNFSYE